MPIKSITRFFALAALFLIPVFSLIVANSFFFPFITGKAFYFRILVEVAFLSWVILAFLDAKYRPKLNALTIGVTIFALVTLVADLVGVNPLRSLWSNFERMEGWITVIHLWMFFMVASSVFGASSGNGGNGGGENRQLGHRWMNVELVAAFLVAGYGLFQLFGWAAIHQGSTRIDASLGNAAYMAVYMLLNVGIAVYLFMESKARRAGIVAKEAGDRSLKIVGDAIKAFDWSVLEWVYAILAVLFAFELYETATRGTILGLVGGIMLALAVYALFAGNKKERNISGESAGIGKSTVSRSRLISGSVVVIVIILIVAFVELRHRPFIANNPILGRLASISLSSSETTARLYIWNMALTGFEQRPILGWGQENFNYIFNANYNPKMYSQEQWFDRAHSVYLDWLTASGIVGLLAYLSLYVLFLYAVWKSSLSVAEKSALTGLLAGYAVHNIFVFDNLASYVLFFAMLAFAASLSRKITPGARLAGASAVMPQVIGGTKEIGIEAVEYVVAPLAIIILVASVYFYNVRPIQENTRLISALESCQGGSAGSVPDPALFESALATGPYVGFQETREQLLSCAGQVIESQQIPGPTKQAFFTLAMNEIQAQIAATPKDARIYTLAGSFLNQIGGWSQAESLLERAHLLSPDKQSTDMELATTYVNDDKVDQALALLDQAYRLATDDFAVKSAYAMTLVYAGREAEARNLFADDPADFNSLPMAQAFMSVKQYSKAIAIYEALASSSPSDVNVQAQLAQAEYQAGMPTAAIQTLKSIETAHPEYATQIDAAIKQIQAGK
jgi:O-antigen ligase/Flp pilus assembly protein TadD